MVRLVAIPQALEHLDGLLHRRLFHPDGSKAALQGAVLFDVTPVLVGGRGADAAQFASGQGRLHHARSVKGAHGSTRTDDAVKLVDEEDNLALRALDLLHGAFEPFLELATKARSSHHRPQIKLHHLLSAEDLGHIILGDLAGQPFGDGCLAHTCLADEHRVVLCSTAEHLDHPQDLGVTPDDRIQFAFTGQLGQVPAELFQRAILALSLRAGDLLATAYFFDDLQDAAA